MNLNTYGKKIISFMLVFVFSLALLPGGILASDDVNYADISRVVVYEAPTHSTLTAASGGGVTITQTDHTDEVGDSDATYGIDFRSSVEDEENRTKTLIDSGLTGNVKITINFIMNNVNQSANSSPFYHLNIPGYLHSRLQNTVLKAMNASSAAGSTNTQNLKTKGVDKENKVVIEIDTVNDTAENTAVKVTMNDTYTYEATSLNVNTGNEPVGSVKYFRFSNMQRMGLGSYLTIKSVYAEGEKSDFSILDSDTQAMLNSLPESITKDPYNVTKNISVPANFSGVKWYTSNDGVMNASGKITRLSESDEKEVTIYALFEGKTTDGKAIEVQKNYYLTVNGINSRSSVTATVNPTEGADETTEKWYTMPEPNGVEDGYPILGDPMNISDEAFFGKWNTTSASWEYQPYFRYSAYPELADVEAYAKAGNYDKAKEALFEYYKANVSKKTNNVTSISATSKKAYNVLYDLLSRNAYATEFGVAMVIDTFKLTKNWSDVNVDVTYRINDAKGSFDIFSTMIVSIDKYRNQAKIYSKESSYDPVLVVKLTDGTTIECPVVKDTYVQAGAYSGTNYGSEKILLAEEAGTYSDFKNMKNYEDRTKRIFIGFDITALKRNMSISSAYVKFKGMHTGSDAEKLMLLYWYCDGSWAENKFCLDSMTDYFYFSCNDMVCWDYVTSHNTGTKGKTCVYHRDNVLSKLAYMYNYHSKLDASNANYIEDYEKYAYTYIRQQMGLINSIGVSRAVMNALDMSCHISGVAEDLLLLIDSEYMNGERFTAILKHLWEMTEYQIYKDFGAKDNNWATFATGAAFAMCARYPELASHDRWLAETKTENERLFQGLTFEDGMCLELSQGYQSTLIGTFSTPYELMALTGAESPYSENSENAIHDMLMSVFNQSIPGYSGFHFGDSTNPYGSNKSLFNQWYGYLFSEDPTIAYMAKSGEVGWLPEKSTTNYPYGMRTFMRSDWSKDALALGITNKSSGSHGHEDALTISMFAYGKFLITDQGYGAILTGNKRKYMISPQQHNVVTVNDYTNYLDPETNLILSSISNNNTFNREVDGEQLCFDSNNQYDFVEYSTPSYVKTQLAQRSVMFLKNQKFWIVTDYVIPADVNAENVFTQNWHLYPGSNMTFSDTKTIRSNFENEPNVMLVPVDDGSIDQIKKEKTLFSEDSGQFLNSEKAVLWKTKTGKATYSTIILPMNVGEDYAVTTKTLDCTLNANDDEANAFSFTVTDQDGNKSNYTYYHVNDEALQAEVTIGNYTTDAQTLLVEEDASGNVVSLYMVNGTFVKKKSTLLIRVGEEDTVAFTITDGVLDFHTDDDISVLEDCKIHSSLATSVKYEHTTVPFTVNENNNMMYFKDVEADEAPGLSKDPAAGKVIFDSALNPELVTFNSSIKSGNEHYYEVSNLGAEGFKFKNLVSVPTKNGENNSDFSLSAGIRLSSLIDNDEENGTKTYSDLFVGKYAIELTIDHSIDTERSSSTFTSINFGRLNSGLTGMEQTFTAFRLYDHQLNLIRRKASQLYGKDNDLTRLALQNLDGDEECKLRVVFDTVNRTYSVFVNDVLAVGAVDYPYNTAKTTLNSDGTVKSVVDTVGTFLPDIQISLMDANSVGSYVWIKNIKLYELESDTDDARIVTQNTLLPSSLSYNPLTGNLLLPSITNVTWASGDTKVVSDDGTLLVDFEGSIPVTFNALASISDTDETGRVFTLKKIYGLTLMKSGWSLKAEKGDDNSVKVSVSSLNDNYNASPTLVIAGYNSFGRVCDIKVMTLTGKLENYNYKLNSSAKSSKVFLFDSMSTRIPLTDSVPVQ